MEGKHILVTGGATGIGAATAMKLAELGAKIWVLDCVEPQYADAAITFFKCDISKADEVAETIKQVLSRAGHLDGAFLNAGIHRIASLEESDYDLIDEVIDINLKGVIYSLKGILPAMREQQKGNIVLMGSDQCFIGKEKSALYGLTKAAIGQLTKSTALDYAAHNVRANCICPGTVMTPIAERALTQIANAENMSEEAVLDIFAKAQPMARVGEPVEIANVVCFLLSEQSSFMTGSLVPVDGGYTAQ